MQQYLHCLKNDHRKAQNKNGEVLILSLLTFTFFINFLLISKLKLENSIINPHVLIIQFQNH